MLSDCHLEGGRQFSGGKFSEVRRADCCVIFLSTQILGQLKFFAGNRHCFLGQKCDEQSVEQAAG